MHQVIAHQFAQAPCTPRIHPIHLIHRVPAPAITMVDVIVDMC